MENIETYAKYVAYVIAIVLIVAVIWYIIKLLVTAVSSTKESLVDLDFPEKSKGYSELTYKRLYDESLRMADPTHNVLLRSLTHSVLYKEDPEVIKSNIDGVNNNISKWEMENYLKTTTFNQQVNIYELIEEATSVLNSKKKVE
jgi:hypothetical protein